MSLSQKLDIWYNDFGRNLPWRGIGDPYCIWLSEIILQQTRIEQGRDYYHRFVKAFPTVADLAAASEEQVLRLWQGLGYYSRARNLHAAAQYIMKECGGVFPSNYEGILKLKGVGRYTAAAIASFAFKLPYPVIDGNVYRFISRLYGIVTPIATDVAYKEFERLLLSQIDKKKPDRFNAALMDFGSLQCKPQPNCGTCPFSGECNALRTGRVEMLPVKVPKARPKDRWFYYFDLRWNKDGERCGSMHRRLDKDIWQGLFEFGLLETDHQLEETELHADVVSFLEEKYGCYDVVFSVTEEYVHQLTHRTIHARFIQAELLQPPAMLPAFGTVLTMQQMKSVPVPRLIDRYLQKM